MDLDVLLEVDFLSVEHFFELQLVLELLLQFIDLIVDDGDFAILNMSPALLIGANLLH